MRIGLTGGLGSGATEAARYLESKGYHIVSGDKIGHKTLLSPSVKSALVKRFGEGILSSAGEIDRRKLGEIVFSDDQARVDLNHIIHPVLLQYLRREVTRSEAEKGVVIVDAALIYEWALQSYFDVMIVVNAPLQDRIARAVARDNLTEDLIRQRIAAQMPLEDKAKLADYVIDNLGSIPQLHEKVDRIMQALLL
ncbi:dephospho-CoA kinase [bacterium]|nr:dephospho-CoA kinase [bacterium]